MINVTIAYYILLCKPNCMAKSTSTLFINLWNIQYTFSTFWLLTFAFIFQCYKVLTNGKFSLKNDKFDKITIFFIFTRISNPPYLSGKGLWECKQLLIFWFWLLSYVQYSNTLSNHVYYQYFRFVSFYQFIFQRKEFRMLYQLCRCLFLSSECVLYFSPFLFFFPVSTPINTLIFSWQRTKYKYKHKTHLLKMTNLKIKFETIRFSDSLTTPIWWNIYILCTFPSYLSFSHILFWHFRVYLNHTPNYSNKMITIRNWMHVKW